MSSVLKFSFPIYSDTCQGDSGGPLMAFQNNRWVVAGITSNGVGCALADYSSIYTRVSSYVGYIRSILDNPNTATTAATIAAAATATTAATTAIGAASTVHSGSVSINFNGKVHFILIICLFLHQLLK